MYSTATMTQLASDPGFGLSEKDLVAAFQSAVAKQERIAEASDDPETVRSQWYFLELLREEIRAQRLKKEFCGA